MKEHNLCLLCQGTGYETIIDGAAGVPCSACQARGMSEIQDAGDEQLKQFYSNVRHHALQLRDNLVRGRAPISMNMGAHSLVLAACTVLIEFVGACYGEKGLNPDEQEALRKKYGCWQPRGPR